MNRFFCSLIMLVINTAAFSQKVYFVYIQSEAAQPFFVKINEKTYSSSPSGFIIVSKLPDSSYNLNVGFPQLKWPEQQFVVNIRSKDQGFLLKNFGEKGWGLFDLQTMGVQMASEKIANEKSFNTELNDVSSFTQILSKAANDPSLLKKPAFAILKEEPTTNDQISETNKEVIVVKDKSVVIPDTTEQLQKKDNLPAIVKKEVEKKESPTIPAKESKLSSKQEEVKAVPLQHYKKSLVVKKSESSTSEGFGLTFVDQYPDGQKDTIKIIIPNPHSILNNTNRKVDEEKKFIDLIEQPKADSLTAAKSLANNNCLSNASESDFLKLRKKMAGQRSEESMISEAKKGFKAKCYTIEQVKNLGNLFLNEAAKFQFYEAAYPFSNDKNNFATLQDEFKDAYFIHRLKNLVK